MNIGVEVGQGWQRVEMRLWTASGPARSPHDDPDHAWGALPIHSEAQARACMQTLPIDQGVLCQLRSLLAMGGRMDVSRLNDAQLLDSVAGLLSDHHLVVFTQVLTPEAIKRRAARQAVPASEVRDCQAVSPSSLHAQPEPAIAAPAAEVPLSPEAEFTPDVQDDQARTLIQAAQEGLPFCEVCMKVAPPAPRLLPPSVPWPEPEEEQVLYGSEQSVMVA